MYGRENSNNKSPKTPSKTSSTAAASKIANSLSIVHFLLSYHFDSFFIADKNVPDNGKKSEEHVEKFEKLSLKSVSTGRLSIL